MRKLPRKTRTLWGLYNQWYGPGEAGRRIAAHMPDAKPLAQVVDRIMGGKMTAAAAALQTVTDEWPSLAGADNARFSRPVSLKDGALVCEVDHPMMLRELRAEVRGMILANVVGRLGPDLCSKLLFVPLGRRQP
jgi:predicted nucleic acid-binding Zn ribbon protein